MSDQKRDKALSELDAGYYAGRFLEPDLRQAIAETSASIPVDQGGGASLLKALILADLVLLGPVVYAVEIGVYRGRLLLPLGHVMKWRQGGQAIGIDPYSAQAAEQGDSHACAFDLRDWAQHVDWDGLYGEVNKAIQMARLENWCRVIRLRSQEAANEPLVQSIDLLHIDGNHDSFEVARDASLYIPKVKVGGYVVLDDISWSSVWPVYQYMRSKHELVFELFDGKGLTLEHEGGNDFAVFRLSAAEPEGLDVLQSKLDR